MARISPLRSNEGRGRGTTGGRRTDGRLLKEGKAATGRSPFRQQSPRSGEAAPRGYRGWGASRVGSRAAASPIGIVPRHPPDQSPPFEVAPFDSPRGRARRREFRPIARGTVSPL